jgi:HD-like signal output (HDOD) protein
MPPAVLNLDLSVRPTPDEVAAELPNLPSAPNVLPCICGVLQEEKMSLQELGNLLRLDAGLLARVYQMGNRLAGVHGEHCLTIEDAINLIGFNRIAAMIGQVAKSQIFARPVSLYGLDAEEWWRWSISCALAAELLAEHTGEDTSIAYTVGLLQSAGIVAIDEWVLRHAPSVIFLPRGLLCEFVESERALLGCTQAEVGAAMLRHWGFPAIFVEPLRWQYAPYGSAGYARMACLLNAAKWLRTVVCTEDERRPPPLPDAVVLRALRLTPERLVRFVVELRIRLGEVRNLVEAVAA